MYALLLLTLSLLKVASSARILAVAAIPSYSHQIFFRPIWLELIKKGHQITLLTTDPMENPPGNIRQINWNHAYEIRHNKHNITKALQENEYNFPKILDIYQAVLNDIVDEELSHPEIETLLRNNSEQFDLMIVEYLTPVLFALSEHFKCPYITISSLELSSSYHRALGNPTHPVLYPDVLFPFGTSLNFKERFLSTLYFLYGFYRNLAHDNSKEEALVKKYFGEGLPSLEEITRKVSLVFVNTNPVFNNRPLGPGFVQIGGGIHLTERKALPKDICEFLDIGEQGVIYFSLGTNVKSHHVNGNLLRAVIETFEELPYKILWKFEMEVPMKSKNVKIMKWVPQQDVLHHKNVKLFITQGGAQSMEEAIFAGVPLLVIPFVSDQKMNAHKVEANGLGLTIDKNTVTKKIFEAHILEIMTNSSFKESVEKTAKLLADEPMTGLEKAVWWTEYVIRHKGVKHFWHPSVNLPVYQYFLLDVLGLLLLITFVAIFIVYYISRSILRWFSRRKSIKQKTS